MVTECNTDNKGDFDMSDEITPAERDELEMLRKEKKARESGGLSLKVSQKGAVSVYGLGRFPLTLYKGQWEKVFDFVDSIKKFIEDNNDQLSVK